MKALLLFLIFLAGCTTTPKDPCTYLRGTSRGAPYNVAIGKTLNRTEKKAVLAAIEAALSESDSLDAESLRFNAASPGQWIPISPELANALEFCGKIVSLSGGRFDPTVDPLSRLWRESLRQSRTPAPSDIQQACDAIGWSHLSVQKGAARKDPGASFDLGAIAKGIAIDAVAEKLSRIGYENLFIEWGGQFRALGRHPAGRDWPVQVNPALTRQGQPFPPILLSNAALAVRGEFRKKGWLLPAESSPDKQPHRFFSIIDPLSAQPLEETRYSIAAAAVIAPSCQLAEALATAAMVFPTRIEAEKWAQEVVEFYPQVSFWILSHDEKR